jgi:hypothetical protein
VGTDKLSGFRVKILREINDGENKTDKVTNCMSSFLIPDRKGNIAFQNSKPFKLLILAVMVD